MTVRRLSNPTWTPPTSTRCGICDEQILPGEPTGHADDERCHRECIRGERDPWSTVDPEWDEAA